MRNNRQRLVALFCLAALSGTSGVLPTLITVAGQLDDDHHVLVSSSGERLQVRFHHAQDAAPAMNAAGELALDGNHRNSLPADHVIEFVSVGDSLAQLPSLPTLDHSLQSIGRVELECWNAVARAGVATPQARPPPGESTWSRCLRAVVLLV